MNDDDEYYGLAVKYEAAIMRTLIPFRYKVLLFVEGIPTGVGCFCWGLARAEQAMNFMVNNGSELLNETGLAADLAAEIYASRREEAMAKVQVGDSVKLLVDIGQYKKGRVCKIIEITEPSDYVGRGGMAWFDSKYPVKVVPVRASTDFGSLGPNEYLALEEGEFGPLDMEVGE